MGKLMPYAGKEERVAGKTARVDLRITPAQRAKLQRVAKASYRSITSLLEEYIDRMEDVGP